MSLGYYKRYPRDFIEGVTKAQLTFEQRGAYSIVLDLIYSHDGDLPDDPRFIAGVLNCSVRLWKSVRQVLIEKEKLFISGNFLTNKRADELLEETAKIGDKNRENGSKPKKYNRLGKPNHNHPNPYPNPIKNIQKIFTNEDFLRLAIERKGVEWAEAWLFACQWRDLPTPAILARTETSAIEIRRELRPILTGIAVELQQRGAA